ncbi:hypothetical protein Ancab_039976 [Ancistrocladus abbreviatus]
MDFWSTLVYILFALISIHYLRTIIQRSRLPPGPFPLPVIGNLLKLGSKPHQTLAELAKAYGQVVSLQLGCLTTVVVSSVPMAKEVLQKNDVAFSSRFVPDAFTALDHHELSVVFLPPSTKWRTFRKICTSLVFANSRLDATLDLRRKKVQQLLSHIEDCSEACKAIDIGQVAFTTTLNFLSNTFFSVDLADSESQIAREFKELVSAVILETEAPNMADFFPILKAVDPQGCRRRLAIFFNKMLTFFNTLINERLQMRKTTGSTEINDVLDALLSISQGDEKEIEFPDIPHLLLDLFVAGTDTTSNTIEWAMAELLLNPEKMRKVQEELEREIGRGNSIEEANTGRLSYLQAVIKETLRLHPLVPFLVPRKLHTNIELCGYKIPKHAQVLVNVWAIGRDPNIWERANLFVPERFLESKIDFKGHDFELIPFGAGRRMCPGLPLASKMIPLILGSLIHSFEWKLADGVTPWNMDMDEKFGFTLQKAQSLIVIPYRML